MGNQDQLPTRKRDSQLALRKQAIEKRISLKQGMTRDQIRAWAHKLHGIQRDLLQEFNTHKNKPDCYYYHRVLKMPTKWPRKQRNNSSTATKATRDCQHECRPATSKGQCGDNSWRVWREIPSGQATLQRASAHRVAINKECNGVALQELVQRSCIANQGAMKDANEGLQRADATKLQLIAQRGATCTPQFTREDQGVRMDRTLPCSE